MRGNAKPEFRVYDDVDAVTDIPAAYFYDELLQCYPDTKCILTVRDEDSWWLSMAKHYETTLIQDPDDLRIALRNCVYGSVEAKEFLYKKKYRQHNQRVRAVIPQDRLLVFDLFAGDGWEKLCAFLEVGVPKGIPFPHVNQNKDRPVWKVRH